MARKKEASPNPASVRATKKRIADTVLEAPDWVWVRPRSLKKLRKKE